MPSAESPRDAVARTIVALERACLDADAAFAERRWTDVDAAFGVQAQLTEELRRLFDAAPATAPAHDAQVARRLDGIVSYRGDQLLRVEAYHAEVGTQLQSIGKVRAFSRSIGKRANAAYLVDGEY